MSEDVKAQDIYLPLSALRSHSEGIQALWTWVKENWSELERRLPPSLSMLSSVVAIATASFTKREHIKDIEAYDLETGTKGTVHPSWAFHKAHLTRWVSENRP